MRTHGTVVAGATSGLESDFILPHSWTNIAGLGVPTIRTERKVYRQMLFDLWLAMQ